MLFRKDIEPCCAYCARGTRLNDAYVCCLPKGVMPRYESCKKFDYDPLKREPERPRKIKPSTELIELETDSDTFVL